MEDNSLAVSFGNSISEDVVDFCADISEVGIDSLLEDGLLKDIPFISTAIAVYRIGKSIRERQHIKKLAIFLDQINRGTTDTKRRHDYQEKFVNDDGFRNHELEYILVILDRYIGFEKPKMLAKVYLSYLNGAISWQLFAMYSEVIDRFLPGDFDVLCSSAEFITIHDEYSDILLRLMSVGLLIEDSQHGILDRDDSGRIAVTPRTMDRVIRNERKYLRTEFGNVLVDILSQETGLPS